PCSAFTPRPPSSLTLFPYTTLFRSVAFTQPSLAGWVLTASLLVRGLGIGAVMGPNIAAAYSSVEKHQASRASSAITVLNRIGGSDRKSTRLNSSHEWISYAVFCLKK